MWEQRASSWYLELNPKATVPTLRDNHHHLIGEFICNNLHDLMFSDITLVMSCNALFLEEKDGV